MPHVFKFVTPPARMLNDGHRRMIRKYWEDSTVGTDLEGSKLLILGDGADIEPVSEGAVLQLAADALDKRGKHVYAKELRKLAGE